MATLTESPVVVEQSVIYDITMTVPEESEGTYSLEVLAPFNDSEARMKICDVFVLSKGVNVPCFTDEVSVRSYMYTNAQHLVLSLPQNVV